MTGTTHPKERGHTHTPGGEGGREGEGHHVPLPAPNSMKQVSGQSRVSLSKCPRMEAWGTVRQRGRKGLMQLWDTATHLLL